jgi:putative DNA primase/helicase
MDNTVGLNERFVMARRLRKIAAEIAALEDLLRLPPEAGYAAGPNAAEQHQLGVFLDSECPRNPGSQVASVDLYDAYRRWAGEAGEPPMSHKMFALLLKQRGFQKYRTSTGVIYLGVGLRNTGHAEVSSGS